MRLFYAIPAAALAIVLARAAAAGGLPPPPAWPGAPPLSLPPPPPASPAPPRIPQEPVAALPCVARAPATSECAAPCLDAERRRGPPELRDGFVIAQPRLTLGPESPDTVGACRSRLSVSLQAAVTFAGSISNQGVPPDLRSPLADAEAHALALTWTRGLGDDLDVGLRLMLQERGGGFLDGLVDEFHQATDLGETNFLHDRYEVSGPTTDGRVFDWSEDGFGLGDLEIGAKWRFVDGGRDGWSLALLGRLTLPTGTRPFEVGGVAGGLQAVAAKRLGRRFDVFAGVGGVGRTERETDDVAYEPWQGSAFAAVEWRPGSRWSLVLHALLASPLVENVVPFSQWSAVLGLTAKIDLSSSVEAWFGTVENAEGYGSSADFSLFAGLTFGF